MRLSKEEVYNSMVIGRNDYGMVIRMGKNEQGKIFVVSCEDDKITCMVSGQVVDTYTI